MCSRHFSVPSSKNTSCCSSGFPFNAAILESTNHLGCVDGGGALKLGEMRPVDQIDRFTAWLCVRGCVCVGGWVGGGGGGGGVWQHW
jgi:hypothetical protein